MRSVCLTGTVICLAMAAGCAAPVDRLDGNAAPAGAASASPTASTAHTPSVSPSGPTLILGPDGLGALKLGMTRTQAEATGLVDPFRRGLHPANCAWHAELRGAPAGGGDDRDGGVSNDDRLGIVAIWAYHGVKTPEGIGIGSPVDDVLRVYPDWKSRQQPGEKIGDGVVRVPGNERARYLISINHGIVFSVALEHVSRPCTGSSASAPSSR